MNSNENNWWFFYPSNIQQHILDLAKLISFKFYSPKQMKNTNFNRIGLFIVKVKLFYILLELLAKRINSLVDT